MVLSKLRISSIDDFTAEQMNNPAPWKDKQREIVPFLFPESGGETSLASLGPTTWIGLIKGQTRNTRFKALNELLAIEMN